MIVAFLDANALYPPTIRSVLMELAQADAYAPLWSEAVHQEWMQALAGKMKSGEQVATMTRSRS